MALTPIAERLAVKLSLPGLPRLGFEHQTFRFRGDRSNRLRHRGGVDLFCANHASDDLLGVLSKYFKIYYAIKCYKTFIV